MSTSICIIYTAGTSRLYVWGYGPCYIDTGIRKTDAGFVGRAIDGYDAIDGVAALYLQP